MKVLLERVKAKGSDFKPATSKERQMLKEASDLGYVRVIGSETDVEPITVLLLPKGTKFLRSFED
ncbi:MAG: hypothetical protein K2H87_03295 [Duncaniella sp.]|nr:hypothetical protein [Duncaniella sp.]